MTSYIYNMVDTWASGGGPYTSIKMNATDNDTGSASLLMNLQVGGTSKFSVSKAGGVDCAWNGNAYLRLDAEDFQHFNGSGIRNMLVGGNAIGIALPSDYLVTWGTTSTTPLTKDLYLRRRGAANLAFGAADAAAPVAQTLSVQSVVAGTTNTAGTNLTITGSQGTGTGAGGSIIFQVAPAGSSGSAQNGLVPALTILHNETRIGIGSSPFITIGHATCSSSAQIGFFYGVVFKNSTLGGAGAALFTAPSDLGGIQLGGTTSSFPALKRNGAGIDIVGADNTNVSFVRVPGVAVASLPSAATAGVGARSFVTDATATTYASTVAGGGANKVPVFSDGTNWIIG